MILNISPISKTNPYNTNYINKNATNIHFTGKTPAKLSVEEAVRKIILNFKDETEYPLEINTNNPHIGFQAFLKHLRTNNGFDYIQTSCVKGQQKTDNTLAVGSRKEVIAKLKEPGFLDKIKQDIDNFARQIQSAQSEY